MKVAVVHARGGSKRIPQKNIKLFFGKPLVFYPLQAALKSEIFDRLVVSTDSKEIAEIAKACGAEVPYLRPKELADDFTPTQDVLKFDIEQLLKDGEVTYACCIYATAVFLKSDYIKKGYETISHNPIRTAFIGSMSGGFWKSLYFTAMMPCRLSCRAIWCKTSTRQRIGKEQNSCLRPLKKKKYYNWHRRTRTFRLWKNP